MSGTIGTNSGRGSGSIGVGASGPTISSSDPAIDTNATLGTQWANSTSGEFYVLTDASAGANVWTNVGDGTGDIIPHRVQGSSFGYVAGSSGYANTIERFSFASNGNGSDVGDMATGRGGATGCCSPTHGMACGGTIASTNYSSEIQKWSFQDGTENATDSGDLTITRTYCAGISSDLHGYVTGGNRSGGTSGIVNIDRFAFSTDSNSVAVGDLTAGRQHVGGTCSATHGYSSGGL